MKAKLIKRDDGYNLAIEQPQGRLLEATCSPSQQLILDKSGASTKHKLSKQNCDEIFGIYSPSELSKVLTEGERGAFEFGYCLAREHNKDKVFTREDMIWARDSGYTNFMTEEMFFDKLDMHNQQPTEIDVEIEMECLDPNCDGIDKKGVCIPGDKPKLDSEGCLILKKI